MIGWGGGLSHERSNFAEAETLGTRRRQHVRHRYARCRRSAGVEGPITSERNASEPERSHVGHRLTTRPSTRGKLRRAKRVLAFGVADLTITLVVGQYREAALHRRPRRDFVIPAFDGWVLVHVDAAAFGETNT